jgi:hypothetical protein
MQDYSEIVNKISKTCNDCGKGTISGYSLENPDPRLFDVRDGDFDEHVAMQPSVMAYYGLLKKEAFRQLEYTKNQYEKWQKVKYQEAKNEIKSEKKATIADIEAYVITNNKDEMNKWEEDLSKLQEHADTLEVYYDAWKQKSFSLREFALSRSDERRTSPHIMEEDKNGTLLDRVRKYKTVKEEG